MTQKIDGNGPAFPCDGFAAQHCPGMTLRDWFAGQALNGLTSDPSIDQPTSGMARWAYAMADYMLIERAK